MNWENVIIVSGLTYGYFIMYLICVHVIFANYSRYTYSECVLTLVVLNVVTAGLTVTLIDDSFGYFLVASSILMLLYSVRDHLKRKFIFNGILYNYRDERIFKLCDMNMYGVVSIGLGCITHHFLMG